MSPNLRALLPGDHLGRASLTTNVSGQKVAELRYLPFGETRWMSGITPTDRRYTGQRELAGVGLYDYAVCDRAVCDRTRAGMRRGWEVCQRGHGGAGAGESTGVQPLHVSWVTRCGSPTLLEMILSMQPGRRSFALPTTIAGHQRRTSSFGCSQ